MLNYYIRNSVKSIKKVQNYSISPTKSTHVNLKNTNLKKNRDATSENTANKSRSINSTENKEIKATNENSFENVC